MNRYPISDASFAQVVDYYQYDKDLPLEGIVIDSWPADPSYALDKVEYRSTHDERVPAYFAYLSSEVRKERRLPAVLLLHGSSMFLGKNEDWAREWRDLLVRQGYCVLCADFYGYGERRRADTLRQPGDYSFRDAFVQCVTDQRRGLDYLLTREEVDPTRIVLMGGSLGGWFGVLVAGLEPRLAGLVLTVSSAQPGGAPTDDPLARFYHTLNFAPRVRAPVLMVNSEADGRPQGEELFEALPNPKRQIWYDHTEHYLPPRDFSSDILDWLHGLLRIG